MSEWLGFASTLIWQVIVVGVVLVFRRQIAALLGRVATIKVGDTEVTLQPPAEDAPRVEEGTKVEVQAIGPGGFFTREGVIQLVENSGMTGAGEEASSAVLIFRTARQRTWLVATDRHLFCVLDDDDTRASGRLIQWRLAHDEARPVRAEIYNYRVGGLSVGPRKRWLYSRELFPEPGDLEEAVTTLLEDAVRG